MERVISATGVTLKRGYETTFGRLFSVWDAALPGFGFKCLGVLGMLLGYNIFVSFIVNRTDAYMNLEKLKLHSKAQGLWKSGFFMSESEDLDARMQDYNL